MDLLRPLDNYCERTGPGLFAEPLNALTNLAFLFAALIVWHWTRGPADDPRTRRRRSGLRILAALLALIGLCSGLFHTTAIVLTAILDVAAIALFVAFFLYRYLRDALARPRWQAASAVAAFILASALMPRTCFHGTCQYLPAFAGAGLIGLHALTRRLPSAGPMLSATLLFTLSMSLRAADLPLCHLIPIGTHWLWHLINANVLTLVCLAYHTSFELNPQPAPTPVS